jgi:curli production assembly/transport component CsgE
MNIVNTHILMVLMFLGTTSQTPLSGVSFQQLIPSTDPIDLEIEGLIVDETQTKIGRDFYELFYNSWSPADYLPKLSIVISERPLPRQGTQVAVAINDNVIFRRFLQPRYDIIEENAQIAIQIVNRYLENYEVVQKQLQGDDLIGTGIY